MAVDRIIKICEVLNIDVKTFEPLNNIPSNNLSQDETTLLENYNKLNDLGKNKLIEYSNDLIETPKYIENTDNIKDLTTATKEESHSLEDRYSTLAAHDDDLTNNEKQNVDMKIMEALKKRQK